MAKKALGRGLEAIFGEEFTRKPTMLQQTLSEGAKKRNGEEKRRSGSKKKSKRNDEIRTEERFLDEEEKKNKMTDEEQISETISQTQTFAEHSSHDAAVGKNADNADTDSASAMFPSAESESLAGAAKTGSEEQGQQTSSALEETKMQGKDNSETVKRTEPKNESTEPKNESTAGVAEHSDAEHSDTSDTAEHSEIAKTSKAAKLAEKTEKSETAVKAENIETINSEIREKSENTETVTETDTKGETDSETGWDGIDFKNVSYENGIEDTDETVPVSNRSDHVDFSIADYAQKDGDVSRETFIAISRIEPNQNQPRKKFDPETLQELADSMKQYGVLQPLLVKKNGMMYEIIAGERRWRAAKLAGLKEIPVLIKSFNDQESAEISIIENIQREDLGPIEEARAYQALIEGYGLTQEEVASRVAKNRTTITNSLRLLQLSEPVLKLLSDGILSAGHARALLSISDAELQKTLADLVAEKKLSVRETEKLVKEALKKKKAKENDEIEQELNMYLIDASRKLTELLGTKVQILQGARGKGKVQIEYYNTDDLNKIIDRLRSE